jgi:thiol-disulfide isomerase/thioredoxin
MPRLRTLLTGAACLLALTGCSGLEGTGDKGYITGDGVIRQIAPADRGDPVELSGETLDGGELDLAELRGEVVVVNTWWSGCGPCRVEMPLLAELGKDLDDAAVVGINIRDTSTAQGLRFMDTVGADFPSLWSPDGKALLAFHGRVNLSSVPSTVVLDREGRPAAVISGEIPGEVSIRDLVAEVAAEDG